MNLDFQNSQKRKNSKVDLDFQDYFGREKPKKLQQFWISSHIFLNTHSFVKLFFCGNCMLTFWKLVQWIIKLDNTQLYELKNT